MQDLIQSLFPSLGQGQQASENQAEGFDAGPGH